MEINESGVIVYTAVPINNIRICICVVFLQAHFFRLSPVVDKKKNLKIKKKNHCRRFPIAVKMIYNNPTVRWLFTQRRRTRFENCLFFPSRICIFLRQFAFLRIKNSDLRFLPDYLNDFFYLFRIASSVFFSEKVELFFYLYINNNILWQGN